MTATREKKIKHLGIQLTVDPIRLSVIWLPKSDHRSIARNTGSRMMEEIADQAGNITLRLEQYCYKLQQRNPKELSGIKQTS